MARIAARVDEAERADGVDHARTSGVGSTFEALTFRRYRLLWAGSLISFLAMQMQMIARGWLAFELTGSNAGLGGVFLGFGVPMLLMTPIGGVVADRLPKRQVLLVCQLALTANAAFIAAAIIFGFLGYVHLVAASVVQGIGFSFLGPARMAFTGELVGHRVLPNAVVLQQMSMNASRVFGPSLAGVLIGVHWFGAGGVYVIVTALLAVTFVATFFLPAGNPNPNRPPRSPFGEMVDGLVYVRERPQLFLLLAVSFMVVMIAFPYQAFLPALAEDVFDVGASGYGVLSAVSAVGAVLASLFIASRAGGPSAWRLQALAGVAFGASLITVGMAPTYVSGLVAIFVVGAGASAFQSLNNSIVLTLSDTEYHGRIQSLMMLSFSGFGMAALPLGMVADAIGLRTTLMVMGAVTVATLAAMVAVRVRLGAREQEHLAEAAASA